MSERDDARTPRAADLLAAYEMGLLDERDRLRFESATLDDPGLLDELFEHASEAQALREDPARYGRVARAALRAAEPSPLARLAGGLRRLFAPRVLVPAVVAAAAVLVLVVMPGGDDLRQIAVLDPAPYAQVDVRAGESDAETLFRDAMAHYLDARWDEAARLLDEALAAGDDPWPQADQARLYLGVSRLLDGDADAALAPLGEAADSTRRPIAERAHWYLAQAHLVAGDAAAAREALGALVDSPVYGADAAAQLDALAQH